MNLISGSSHLEEFLIVSHKYRVMFWRSVLFLMDITNILSTLPHFEKALLSNNADSLDTVSDTLL